MTRARWAAPLILALHTALVIPGIFANSATFDENFHLPAGVIYLARGYTHVSIAQPPLARALYALPVMAMRPVVPPDSLLRIGAERTLAESFVRLNASRYPRMVIVARFVGLALSLLLGWLIFGLASGICGEAAGLLALAAWAVFPDAVAQAGLAGMDLPTALSFLIVMIAFRALVRRPGIVTMLQLTLAFGVALLTRFSALQLIPILAALTVAARLGGKLQRPQFVFLSLVVAAVGGVLLLDLGYLGQVSFLPMGQRATISRAFHDWALRLPWLRLPLPDAYVAGLDYLRDITESRKTVYLLGTSFDHSLVQYFPIALAFKWPLGLLALILARLWFAFRAPARNGWDEACLLVPAGAVLLIAMASDLDYGVRYLLPAVPFLCVWASGLMARASARPGLRVPSPHWARMAVALVAVEAAECAFATPWQLAFFNVLAGGHGDRIVNDSNVDWGQGLIALRSEMKRRGIRRIHLAYHGTTDPAIYGIDYLPFTGGAAGKESDWLAASSYYFVGLPQRMITPEGDTPFLAIDFSTWSTLTPVARPARCMYLFRLR